MTYIKENMPASLLADARRAVSERMVPKLKAFILSILRQEKNCHSLAKVDAEALLEEQREIVDALAWGKEHASIQQRSALRELKKNLTGLIAAGVELRKKGEKKSHLARALDSDKHLHLGLSAMAQISKAFQAQHKAKEKIYKENDDRDERKKLVKLLLLHERLAKNHTMFGRRRRFNLGI